jgi:GDP-L-fucose synthase
MVGTVCFYSRDCPIPFKEEYLMHYGFPELTNLAYGVAKLNSLIGAQAFAKQYGLNVCNLIPVNMYGPHDHFDPELSHVIPAIIKKLYDAKHNNLRRITLWGTGIATREFLYVEDFTNAIILALRNLNQPDLINIGTGSEISIANLATKIAAIIGYGGDIKWDSTRPDGQPRRCLDISKAESLFGFKAQVKIDDGLQRTIDWYCSCGE